MQTIEWLGLTLRLLPEKAIYIEQLSALLVSDVHLGKAETFQAQGIPITNQLNHTILNRLTQVCDRLQPQTLYILGDLFHSRFALVEELLDQWAAFQRAIAADITLIVGNHDRALISSLDQHSIHWVSDAIALQQIIFSHEPQPDAQKLNICGHIHPCVRIGSKLDTLRLPCFFWDKSQNLLILPSFGDFTGSFEMALVPDTVAYVVAEDAVVAFEGQMPLKKGTRKRGV
jgi:uncharacterized protein